MLKNLLTIFLLSISVITIGNDFNVKKYGAIGDGVTDDAPAIQRAIDAAQVSGGCVFFPQGKYRVKKTLYVSGVSSADPKVNWVTLRGCGIGSQLLGDGINFILSGRPNVGSAKPWMNGSRIESLTFTSFDLKNRCNGIDMNLMLRVFIESCNFLRLKSALSATMEFTPHKDPKKKQGHAIWIVRINKCVLSHNSDIAINLRRVFDVVISNNIIEDGNGGIQIGFIEDAKDSAACTLRIENNVIEGLKNKGNPAIRLCCVVGGRIMGNYFEANPSGDIEIIPGKGGWVRGFVISSNTFQPTKKQREGEYGPIWVEKAFDLTINNNFTSGPRLIHPKSKQLGRNVVVFGNAINNPPSIGNLDGVTAEERKKYERIESSNTLNRNRLVLGGKTGHIGIDTNKGIVFGKNTISYGDGPTKKGNIGDIVFCRKPVVKNGKLMIGWYCVNGGNTARWLPFSVNAEE